MTTLLKRGAPEADSAIDVLSWRPADGPAHPVHDEETKRLEAEIERLRAALADAKTSHGDELVRAREEARSEAEAAHVRDDKAALEILKAGVTKALEAAGEELERLDALTPTLCESALERLLADPSKYDVLVTDALRRQTDALRDEAMLHVDVSADDFPDGKRLEALAADLGKSAVAFRQDAGLTSGSARISLRLGAIDVSVPRYWDELRELCRNAAADNAP